MDTKAKIEIGREDALLFGRLRLRISFVEGLDHETAHGLFRREIGIYFFRRVGRIDEAHFGENAVTAVAATECKRAGAGHRRFDPSSPHARLPKFVRTRPVPRGG